MYHTLLTCSPNSTASTQQLLDQTYSVTSAEFHLGFAIVSTMETAHTCRSVQFRKYIKMQAMEFTNSVFLKYSFKLKAAENQFLNILPKTLEQLTFLIS